MADRALVIEVSVAGSGPCWASRSRNVLGAGGAVDVENPNARYHPGRDGDVVTRAAPATSV